MSDTIYTIGHSTHPIDKLLALLKRHAITVVCDVRSQPYSQTNPQFNREPLKQALRAEGISYVFLGKELGAKSSDKSCYRNGRVQYDLLAQTDLFRQGLERVKNGAKSYRVVLMCAEKEPLECHRTILVSRHLVEQGMHVLHILSDGRLEEHEQSLQRLIDNLELRQLNLFGPVNDIISNAYRIRGNAIAYHEKPEPINNDPILTGTD
ncbi:MAG: DUF488 domain-containing protein [Syntrophobacteraceae bacterium]